MIVNDDHRFIFVCVAKTGSTSIRRRFDVYDDPPPEGYHMFLKDILNLHPHASDYFKFAFVRNPYDRMFSAYINLKYDGHVWATELKKTKSFEEFVLNFKGSEYSKYIHLQPQSDYVKINGKVAVDFLGRFENLEQDFQYIEKKLNLNSVPLKMLRVSSKNKEQKTFSPKIKGVIREIYAEDFETFGYE